MADVMILTTADRNNLLVKRGAALGITEAEIMDLITKFGPYVAQLLIDLLEHKRQLGVPATASAFDVTLLEKLLAQFLKTYEAQVVTWVDSGEGAVFDAFVGILAGKAPLLAALLKAYRATLLSAADAETVAIINQLIAILSTPTPAPAPVGK